MNKLSKVISDISYDELKLIKLDLQKGNIETLINNRIKQFEVGNKIVCPVCNSKVNDVENAYTLIFGPKEFRRKASFCATDCLEYFIGKLNETNKKKVMSNNGTE